MMSRKILLPVFAAAAITAIAVLVVSSTALAQGEGPLRRLRRVHPVFGQVTAISGQEFTLEKRDGTTQTFKVNENTIYRGANKAELSFEDLETGQWVAVVIDRRSGDLSLARAVGILPEDFDPDSFEAARGRVAEVNVAGNSFTLENRAGEEQEVEVDSDTIYRGQVSGLADLEVGMLAGVVTKEADGEPLLAKVVRAGYPQRRHAGQITAVDESAGTFTLKTRRSGEELTFVVDENTRFRSKGGTITELGDLKAGMVALVVGRVQAGPGEDGTPLLALVVAAGEKPDLSPSAFSSYY
jgi:hypothetical protein